MKFGNLEVHLNPDLFCDTRIVCKGGSISTHRVILGAGSSFLASILKDQCPGLEVTLILPDFSRLDACTLLSVLYGDSGELEKAGPERNDIFQTLRCNAIDPQFDRKEELEINIETAEKSKDYHYLGADDNKEKSVKERDVYDIGQSTHWGHAIIGPLAASGDQEMVYAPSGDLENEVNGDMMIAGDNANGVHKEDCDFGDLGDIRDLSGVSDFADLGDKVDRGVQLLDGGEDESDEAVCSRRANSLRQVYSVASVESTAKGLSCNEAGQNQLMETDIPNSHKETREKPFRCDTCGKSYKSKAILKEHMRIHTGQFNFECKFCKMSFLRTFNLSKHYKSAHPNEKPYQCELCQKTFKQRIILRKHKKSHGSKPFRCNSCNKGFISKGNLTEHMRIHSGERPFKCDICCRAFKTKGQNTEHRRLRHPQITRNESETKNDLVGSLGQNTEKQEAAKIIESTTEILIQDGIDCDSVEEFENDIMTDYVKVEPGFQCNEYSQGFQSSVDLERHSESHRAKNLFDSDICVKSLKTRSDLNGHKKDHGSKPYECDISVNSFETRSDLNGHKKDHRSKPYECDICVKSFKTRFDLNAHKKDHGSKPYECEFCHKGWINQSHLARHKRMHTGERPYKCDVCPKEYKVKSHLREHETRRHKADRNKAVEVNDDNPSPKKTKKRKNMGYAEGNEKENTILERRSTSKEMKKRRNVGNTDGNDKENTILEQCSTSKESKETKKMGNGEEIEKERDILEPRSKEKEKTKQMGNGEENENENNTLESQKLLDHEETDNPYTEIESFIENWSKGPAVPVENNSNISTDTEEKKLSCRYCSKSFRRGDNLTHHYRSRHPNQKPYECAICLKVFTDRKVMLVHRKDHGPKPFKCDLCDQATVNLAQLTIHKRIHTGERPYACDVCPKAFKVKSHLNEHKMRHTAAADKKICGNLRSYSGTKTRPRIRPLDSVKAQISET